MRKSKKSSQAIGSIFQWKCGSTIIGLYFFSLTEASVITWSLFGFMKHLTQWVNTSAAVFSCLQSCDSCWEIEWETSATGCDVLLEDLLILYVHLSSFELQSSFLLLCHCWRMKLLFITRIYGRSLSVESKHPDKRLCVLSDAWQILCSPHFAR